MKVMGVDIISILKCYQYLRLFYPVNKYLLAMSSTSTPLSIFSSNTSNPPILQSTDSNESSFCSALSSVPNVPELSDIPAKKGGLLRKRIYHCITLLCLVSCLSLLIFISLNLSRYITFSGNLESNLKIPAVGGLI